MPSAGEEPAGQRLPTPFSCLAIRREFSSHTDTHRLLPCLPVQTPTSSPEIPSYSRCVLPAATGRARTGCLTGSKQTSWASRLASPGLGGAGTLQFTCAGNHALIVCCIAKIQKYFWESSEVLIRNASKYSAYLIKLERLTHGHVFEFFFPAEQGGESLSLSTMRACLLESGSESRPVSCLIHGQAWAMLFPLHLGGPASPQSLILPQVSPPHATELICGDPAQAPARPRSRALAGDVPFPIQAGAAKTK